MTYDNIPRKGQLKLKQKSIGSKQQASRQSTESRTAKNREIRNLTGRILVTKTNVQGLNTLFLEEAAPGDLLALVNPQSLISEERVITKILTNRVLTIDQPLSSDFVSTVEASVVKQKGVSLEEQLNERNTQVAYREKKGLSYKVVVEQKTGRLTNDQLLETRIKRVHDKYAP